MCAYVSHVRNTTRFVSFPVCLGTREQEICGLYRIIILGTEKRTNGGRDTTNREKKESEMATKTVALLPLRLGSISIV